MARKHKHLKTYYNDLALKTASLIADAKHLHYGYFAAGIKPTLENLNRAQDKYLEKILSYLPRRGVKRILDVGCGTGAVAAELVKRGYEVTCIAPDPFLIEKTRENTRDRVRTLTNMYENIEDELEDHSFDLILMSESCQYIKPPSGWPQHSRFLRPKGYILISDFFRIKPADERNPSRSGQMWDDFLLYVERHGFKMLKEVDITKYTAPTMDIYQDFINQKIIPGVELVFTAVERAVPSIYKITRFFARKRLLKLKDRYQKQGADLFREYKSYKILLIQKA